MEGSDEQLEDEIEAYIQNIIQDLPISDKRLKELRMEQERDETCQVLKTYIADGWPEKKEIHHLCGQYWSQRHEIGIQKGLLMRGKRPLIPVSMHAEIILRLHDGHQGINKCRARARETVW